MASRPSAARCALHEEWISDVRDTLADLRVQAENHSVGLAQLVKQREVQNGRLERVEQRVWWIIVALACASGAMGFIKAADALKIGLGG